MKILVDGVLLQRTDPRAPQAERCVEILKQIVAAAGAAIAVVVLDRGGVPDLGDADIIPFPTYRASESVSDSGLLQRMCDAQAADVFVSTCLTTPLTTPTMQLLTSAVRDLPDMGGDPETVAREREIAMLFSTFVVHAAVAAEARMPGFDPADRSLGRHRPVAADGLDSTAVAALVLDRARRAPAEFAETRSPAFMTKWAALKKMQAAFET